MTDEEAAEEAGLSEAALDFDLDDPVPLRRAGAPGAVLGLRAGHLAGDPRAHSRGGRPRSIARACCSRATSGARASARCSRCRRAPRCGRSVSRFYQPPQPEYLLLASSPDARELSPFLEDGGAGGADIEPERQWAFDAGIEHRFGRGLAARRRRLGAPRRRIRRPQRVLRHDDHLPERGGLRPGPRRRRPAGDAPPAARGPATPTSVSARSRRPARSRAGCSSRTTSPTSGLASSSCRITISACVASGGLTWTGRRGVTISADGALRERHADRARRRRRGRRAGRAARRRTRRLRQGPREAAHDRVALRHRAGCGRRRARR